MDQQKAWDVAKRGQSQALAAGDHDVLAQLQSTARHAHHYERLQDAPLGSAQLVTEDHRDTEHELDLLLEGVERLARHRADGEDGPQTGGDRSRAADRTGRRHAAACGTDQQQRQLIVGVVRVRGAKLVDFGPDCGLPALHRLIEGAEDETNLRRELIQIHGGEAYRSPPPAGEYYAKVMGWGLPSATGSHKSRGDLSRYLRRCRDKA